LLSFAYNAFSQTLYVPSGTSGIGSSSTANVGIGVSAPAEKLQINGSVRGNQSGALRVSTGYGYMDIGPKNTSFAHFYTDRPLYYFDKGIRVSSGSVGSYSGDLYLNTAGTTTLTLSTDGTSSFIGNVYIPFSKWYIIGVKGQTGDGYPRLAFHHTGTHGYIDYKDNLHFRADDNWNSALTLYGDGSVGVGFYTTYNTGDYRTQGYKLAVNGGILCESVVVIQDVPNSDYVFDADYNLKELKDVEKFINDNKHLPDVPSAKEFQEKGSNMGKMDDLLLRKVEELTLYLIEQNKRLEILEAENKELKSKLNF